MIKKLIEVALPLDAINGEASREKSIRYGHPSTLHLWWARRPLAAARAVIWASLVDDPSSHPELFPTEADQEKERKRLFDLLTTLVKWESSSDEYILSQAKNEIKKWNPQGVPELLDPFSGGGAIPLEGSRLGMTVHAHDLNPVAITINKAMEEIPNRFRIKSPISNEGINHERSVSSCLAADVKHYANILKRNTWERVKNLYPKIKDAGIIQPIAWIWAHTVECPNPVCRKTVPLMRGASLVKGKNSSWIDISYPNGKLTFSIKKGGKPTLDGTINRKGAVCPCCGSPIELEYVRKEGRAGRMGDVLMAVVGEGDQGRLYYGPLDGHEKAARIEMPSDYPDAIITANPRDFKTPNYGMTHFSKLFTPRQMTTLVTFCDELSQLVSKIEKDAIEAGLADDGKGLEAGGKGAKAYSEAIKVYLAFIIDKLADRSSMIASWDSSRQNIRNTFGRQAIPMVWDYAEVNMFSHSSGSFDNMLEWVVDVLEQLPSGNYGSEVSQFDAQSDCGLRNIMVSTDPPYYDNIAYADLSDYFYIWLRRNLRDVFPHLYSTMLVPKTEELVAMAHRFNGDQEQAKEFFEDGMHQTCRQIYKYTRDDIPVTIYYAYKQSETEIDENSLVQTASSGWETMLSAIIESGFVITGTWPMRTEMSNRMIASESNALSSSVVLVCRKRPLDAPICTRREFVSSLKAELKTSLKKLQSSNIAPVDMAQSAIGPGIGVFSRYSKVLEADGKEMTVREALRIINQELDTYFSEQGSTMDAGSRFCVDVFNQYGFNAFKFGDADILARAKNTSVSSLEKIGIVASDKGQVHLVERKQLPAYTRASEDSIWLLTQQLTFALEDGGVKAAAQIVHEAQSHFCERAKDLAYRLYSLCERKKWNQEGYAYNSLVMSWNEILNAADDLTGTGHEQLKLF